MAGICYADYRVPDNFVLLDDYFRDNPNVSLPTGYASLGEYRADISQFRGVSVWDKEDLTEVFCDLMSRLFEVTGIEPSEVSYIMHTETLILKNQVSVPHYLLRKYRMKNASVCPILHKCSASLLGIELSESVLSRKGKYSIIISAQSVPRFENRFSRKSVSGDGAAILVISRESTDYEIIDFASQSSGQGSYEIYEGISAGEGYVKSLSDSVQKMKTMLKRNKLTISDVNTIIPQNVNVPTLEGVFVDTLGFPKNKIFSQNLSFGGHMSSVDVVRNFKDFTDSVSVPTGAYIVLFSIGMSVLGLKARDSDFRYVLLRRNIKTGS